MFSQEIVLFRFMQGYLEKLLTDLSDEELGRALPGAVNPPIYVLGHLAISNDFTLGLLGQPTVCPQAWMEAFGPGSSPENMKIPYPTRQELMSAIRRGHECVCSAVPSADPQAMAQPQSFSFFENTPIKTVGDCVALLLTTHFSLHIGQLSLMRRQLGKPPLF
jgi:hypothetical protein